MTATKEKAEGLSLEELEQHFERCQKQWKERKIYRDHNDKLWYNPDGVILLWEEIQKQKEALIHG